MTRVPKSADPGFLDGTVILKLLYPNLYDILPRGLQAAAVEEDGETDEERVEREKKADAAERRAKKRANHAKQAEEEKDKVSDQI